MSCNYPQKLDARQVVYEETGEAPVVQVTVLPGHGTTRHSRHSRHARSCHGKISWPQILALLSHLVLLQVPTWPSTPSRVNHRIPSISLPLTHPDCNPTTDSIPKTTIPRRLLFIDHHDKQHHRLWVPCPPLNRCVTSTDRSSSRRSTRPDIKPRRD